MKALKAKSLCAGGFVAIATLVFLCGCQNFNSEPGDSLTSVLILNSRMAVVHTSITNVFVAHQFYGGKSGTNQFTYKRAGTKVDNMIYGSYMFDRPTVVKVVLNTVQQDPDTIRLSCKAWILEEDSDPVFQDAHPVRYFRREPYEDLLKEVRLRCRIEATE